MPCFHPLTAYRSSVVNPSGKRSLVFNRQNALDPDHALRIPCGKCQGCLLSRARQWATRCTHEASLYPNNCFVTFTFAPEHLDPEGSLRKEDFVLFMKRLRWKFGEGIRFFHCGEYGEKGERPHHHAILFNCDFPDKVPCGRSRGYQMYNSETLDKLWGKGFCSIGSVTFESTGYIARYHLKKVFGKEETEKHYGSRVPEYITMSNRGGIGKGWYDKYNSDVYPSDLVVLPGNKKLKPPKYYDRLLEREDPSLYASVKAERKKYAFDAAVKEVLSYWNSRYDDDGKLEPPRTISDAREFVLKGFYCDERLSVRERVQLYKLDKLKRGYENGDRETLYSLRC